MFILNNKNRVHIVYRQYNKYITINNNNNNILCAHYTEVLLNYLYKTPRYRINYFVKYCNQLYVYIMVIDIATAGI
jgi:hypothetical protein